MPDPVTPLPDGLRVIKVSDARDGDLLNRGYPYWPQSCVIEHRICAFVGHVDQRPRFFRIDPESGLVERLGPLLSYRGTSEGWYWDMEGWIYLLDGPRLRRVNPFSGEDRVVCDISSTYPGCDLWQTHSSEDGRTHSATVRQVVQDGAYPKIGSAVFRDGSLLRFEPPTLGEIDESAISANGRYWLIKESEDAHNRIIDLDRNTERILRKDQGALGHSDMGPDWAIGDDRTVGGASWMNLANPDDRRVLTRFPDWNMGHVSIKAGRCLLSHGDAISLLDPLTGEVQPLAQAGMVGSGYEFQVMATLSPDGRVASWASNAAGRMDLYLLLLPI